MFLKMRCYCSVLLCFLWMLPFAAKSIHGVTHIHKEHCHSLSDTHFHELEHHCKVCDFKLNFGSELSLKLWEPIDIFIFKPALIVNSNFYCSEYYTARTPRAPPAEDFIF